MSTTDLFVELIVIGVGAAVWLLLRVFTIFGIGWVSSSQLLSLVVLVPALAIVYVLGIVVDRVADALFDRFAKPTLRRSVYKSSNDRTDLDDRQLIYLKGGRLAELLLYGRSRLRICRGWTLNSLLILVALNLFAAVQIADPSLSLNLHIFGSLALLLFAYGNFYSWRELTLNDYRKVKNQATYLREHGETQRRKVK